MKKQRCSIKYMLLHLLCFLMAGTVIVSFKMIFDYTNPYGTQTESYFDTYEFQSKYVKYIERLTLYLYYTESGYSLNYTTPSDVDEIQKNFSDDTKDILNERECSDQDNFEFYNYCLNVAQTNFLYYAINTKTGNIYYSPYLDQMYPNDVNKFIQDIKTYPAYFSCNTSSVKFASNLKTSPAGLLDKSEIKWIVSQLTSAPLDQDSCFIIYTGIVPDLSNPEDVFYNMHNDYISKQRGFHIGQILLPVSALLFLACFILLVIQTGHHRTSKADDTQLIYLNGFDHIKTEIAAGMILASMFLAAYIFHELFYGYDFLFYGRILPTLMLYSILYFPSMFGLFSLIRRIKAHTVISNSVTYRLGCYLIQRTKEFFRQHKVTYRAIGVFLLFAGIQGISILCYLITLNEVLAVILFLLSYLYLFVVLIRTAIDLGVVLEGTKSMQSGDLNLKLPCEHLASPVKELGEYINNIGTGLSVAVEERTKSERFKAELITNVSHDIKTPLTSIINYVDLMKKEPIDNPKVQEYLKILTNKSWRLKTLIEDLVEASKASSGAIKMNPQKINLVELVKQAAGEFDDRFHDNKLELIIATPEKPVSIYADGRSTYRVIDNLLSNVNKYAMAGTRVYVDVMADHGYGILSMKNISREKLNITPDELMERFVRGDVSRNTEGSGLGLSISRSLTTLQHGSFQLDVDGDLFKVIVSLPLYETSKQQFPSQ